MNVRLFSDLHVDVSPIKPISIADGIDTVVVAGDTCEGAVKASEHLRQIVPMPVPILMVLGNHKYYRSFVPDELALARAQVASFNIHLLEDDTVELNGVRFVGATLDRVGNTHIVRNPDAYGAENPEGNGSWSRSASER